MQALGQRLVHEGRHVPLCPPSAPSTAGSPQDVLLILGTFALWGPSALAPETTERDCCAMWWRQRGAEGYRRWGTRLPTRARLCGQ